MEGYLGSLAMVELLTKNNQFCSLCLGTMGSFKNDLLVTRLERTSALKPMPPDRTLMVGILFLSTPHTGLALDWLIELFT